MLPEQLKTFTASQLEGLLYDAVREEEAKKMELAQLQEKHRQLGATISRIAQEAQVLNTRTYSLQNAYTNKLRELVREA